MDNRRLGILQASLAFLWLWSAVVSLCLSPQQSLDLLAAIGVGRQWQCFLLWAASGLDALLALLYLTAIRRKRCFYLGQLLLVGFYSLIVAWKLPATIADPLAPLMKNVPTLALLFFLYGQSKQNKASGDAKDRR